jgi:hypothetical protein
MPAPSQEVIAGPPAAREAYRKMTMKLKTVGVVIAIRKLDLSSGKKVTVVIGKPRKFRTGIDYYCPYQIRGIGDGLVRYAGGIDPVQALQLTLMQIGAHLYASEEAKAGHLSWEAGSTKGDLGFPVPHIIRDLLPGEQQV